MSIFSFLGKAFTSIEDFISNLLTSVKKEYLNLEPVAKSLLDGSIKFGNVLKTYIANPSSAGLVAGELISLVEGILGSGLTTSINAVIGEVVVDLGIADTALTDPVAAYQELLNHLAQFKGKAFADKLFNTVENIALRITGLADNNEIKAIIAIAYKLFFSSQAATAVVSPVQNASQVVNTIVADTAQQTSNPVQPVSVDLDTPADPASTATP